MDESSCKLNSISAKLLAEGTGFLEKLLSYLSPLPSDPLFSSIVTIYVLVLLYFPGLFLGIVFSPVLISTVALLLTLLRLGATQKVEEQINSTEPEVEEQINSAETEEIIQQESVTGKDLKLASSETNLETQIEVGLSLDYDPDPFYPNSFVEWNVRAPLEVIYEEYEGEEDDHNDDVPEEKRGTLSSSIERYPSLSLCFPDTDSDSSSDGDFPAIGRWGSPESLYFMWEEEDREGLIEIALDRKTTSVFPVEEDNLIEIDISPSRTPNGRMNFSARNGEISGTVGSHLTLIN
ncbi:hypothetical protein NMG60_11012608 [Bertholletia excelsa]